MGSIRKTIADLIEQKYPKAIVSEYDERYCIYIIFRHGVHGWLDNDMIALDLGNQIVADIPFSDPDFFDKLHSAIQ